MHTRNIDAALVAAIMLSVAPPCLAQQQPGAPAAPSAKAPAKKDAKAAEQVKPIDINSASKAELKNLPNIGDAEADKIIAGRPYLSKADLVTRKIIPEGYYVAIRRMIVALPKSDPAKAPAKKG